MKKKLISLIVVLLSAILIVGCAQSGPAKKEETAGKQASEEIEWPTKPIRFIVPFAPGGGTDLAARTLQPYLEKELGVSVVIENKTGGGGWVGWGDLANSEPDGYTLGYMVFPNIFTGYLNPTANRQEKLDSFEYIVSHHVDSGLIVVKGDEKRFSNIEEFIEYAKKNEIAGSSGGVGSSPHFAGVQINDQLGTNIRFVHGNGGAEAIAQLLGGHIDIGFLDYSSSKDLIESGELKVLAVLGSDRFPKLPDVPAINEVFDTDIQKLLSRGIAAPKGVDPAILEELETAMDKAMNNPEHIEKLAELGVEIHGIKGEEYMNYLKEQEASMIKLKSVFGW
ncbi:tripartite tricarboxylate transporter substrate binding protein [Neobacillus sp. 3P2-tot-E-2]|uniref:tripartite tricarboxylate transporter substrate binding protein n=1 Tax=Neobacillus sp. 3P2-tot-E-2 TaxID=3132212 RepID=UPI0039A38ED8